MRGIVVMVRRYLAARQEAWELLAEGIRTGDQAALNRFADKTAEADRLVAEIQAWKPPGR